MKQKGTSSQRQPSGHKPEELSEKAFLFDYHDAFYKIFHLPLDWIPTDNSTFTICGKSHCNALCNCIMESEEGMRLCSELLEKRVETARRTGKPVVTSCHAGFYDAVIPITINNVYLGSLCLGQFLKSKPTARQIQQVKKRLGFLKLRPGALERFYKETRILGKSELEGLIELLQMLGSYICETYNHRQFLASFQQSDPITEATKYIQNHYAQSITIDGLAHVVCMSKSNFIHRFSEQVGYSPLVYLNRYRISQACEMLQKSKMTIAQIAEACGFSNITHFNRLFKRYMGETPMEYRNKTSLYSPRVGNG
ncbi:MAG: PocR ligand-binding domain-containing protein [Victivallales bacterium]|nr:PocR ligand-binding domain-containing protein [Victivallales bacterium]